MAYALGNISVSSKGRCWVGAEKSAYTSSSALDYMHIWQNEMTKKKKPLGLRMFLLTEECYKAEAFSGARIFLSFLWGLGTNRTDLGQQSELKQARAMTYDIIDIIDIIRCNASGRWGFSTFGPGDLSASSMASGCV